MAATAGDPNFQGPFGNTLLHGAVLSGDLGEVRRLLAAGADPRLRNREGRTAAQIAMLLGDRALCELIEPQGTQHVDRLLDQALEQTFPASDPVAVTPGSHTRP